MAVGSPSPLKNMLLVKLGEHFPQGLGVKIGKYLTCHHLVRETLGIFLRVSNPSGIKDNMIYREDSESGTRKGEHLNYAVWGDQT